MNYFHTKLLIDTFHFCNLPTSIVLIDIRQPGMEANEENRSGYKTI